MSRQSNYSCKCCGKTYMKKTAYANHMLICEFLQQSKSERKTDDEEGENLPSYHDLVKIVQFLSVKTSRLEEKVEQIQKWVDKSKKKISILDWLNANVEASISYDKFVQDIVLDLSYVDYLNEHNMIKTMTLVLENYFQHKKNVPIKAFNEKTNKFYIYDNENSSWVEMQKDQIISLLYLVDRTIQIIITKWRNINEDKITNNDKWSQTYNKLISKANAISYRDEHILSKMKTILFNQLKCDVKRYVEYEFEY